MKNSIEIAPDPLGDKEIFVGKDILELLSSSMYVNPLAVFREYVQNSVDAIDDAVATGVLPSVDDGVIEINVDHIDRRVIIRDNGAGLANNDFPKRMLSFGASEKRGTSARGFRGVGRLSSLGHVQQLVFRSRAKGDPNVLEATWNGRAVKRLLASLDSDIDLRAIVRQSVNLKVIDPDGYPDHFFEVELLKPRRIANDKLLNEAEIEFFVAQTCPCPFSPDFSYRHEISALLDSYLSTARTYKIFVNGSDTPVYRPYRNKIKYSDTRVAKLGKLRTFEIEGLEGQLAAIGWLIHHEYQGAIPVSQGIRGLRARVGNMQVGDDRLFADVFPEDRFCSWTIGELHVLDSRIVPNGRRDEFNAGGHLDNILAHLRPIASEVARRCRISSQQRNRLRSFDLGFDKVIEKLAMIEQGAVSEKFAKSVKGEIGGLLSEMRKTTQFDLFEEHDKAVLVNRLADIEKLVDAHSKKPNGEALDNIPPRKRALYKEVFDLVYECSTNQAAAKSLIDRMLGRLSRS